MPAKLKATLGSTLGKSRLAPTPRMNTWVLFPSAWKRTEGTIICACRKSVIPASIRTSADIAVTSAAAFCKFSDCFSAVTVISARASLSVGVSARTGAATKPASDPDSMLMQRMLRPIELPLKIVSAVPIVDLTARLQPDIAVRGDVAQCRLDVLHPKRMPRDEGVHRDGHDPRPLPAFITGHPFRMKHIEPALG